MTEKVLVSYASKYGSTAEIAQKITQQLQKRGISVTLLPVDEVTDLEEFSAVVLGSAVYAGQWRKPAADFLKERAGELAARKVWLFSSGPTGVGKPEDLMHGWRFPENLQPVADQIQPQETAFFHGALEEEKLGFAEKLIVKGLQAPLGDYRDWERISGWAAEIADRLRKNGQV